MANLDLMDPVVMVELSYLPGSCQLLALAARLQKLITSQMCMQANTGTSSHMKLIAQREHGETEGKRQEPDRGRERELERERERERERESQTHR